MNLHVLKTALYSHFNIEITTKFQLLKILGQFKVRKENSCHSEETYVETYNYNMKLNQLNTTYSPQTSSTLNLSNFYCSKSIIHIKNAPPPPIYYLSYSKTLPVISPLVHTSQSLVLLANAQKHTNNVQLMTLRNLIYFK